MHQPPVITYATCERCNCRVKVAKNRERRVCYCQDCLDMMDAEKRRARSNWGGTGTFHLIYDPDNSWGPCGGWFSRIEIITDICCFTPGTRFDARGDIYVITANYRLERIAPN